MACIRIADGFLTATLNSELADPRKPPGGYIARQEWAEHWSKRPHPFYPLRGQEQGGASTALTRRGKSVRMPDQRRCWICGKKPDHKKHAEHKEPA